MYLKLPWTITYMFRKKHKYTVYGDPTERGGIGSYRAYKVQGHKGMLTVERDQEV